MEKKRKKKKINPYLLLATQSSVNFLCAVNFGNFDLIMAHKLATQFIIGGSHSLTVSAPVKK